VPGSGSESNVEQRTGRVRWRQHFGKARWGLDARNDDNGGYGDV
jgi:hypothetical protein